MRKQKNAGRNSGNGVIRIISGQWRGRKLPVAALSGLRPTTDRVKETLFNWLMQDVAGAKCLDCFAGTGGLGLEALSRYAAEVLFIEKDAKAAKQIQTNLATLQSSNSQVINADTLNYFQQQGQAYDIVFIDPPFRQELAGKCIALLDENGWVRQGSLIYLEVESELSQLQLPGNWQLLKEKNAGQVSYRLFVKQ